MGNLVPFGCCFRTARTAPASAVVRSLGFGCLWLALSSLTVVWCKQHCDAVGCLFGPFCLHSVEVLHSGRSALCLEINGLSLSILERAAVLDVQSLRFTKLCYLPAALPARSYLWENCLFFGLAAVGNAQTWLILPVVICLSQRLSHACLSISFYTAKLRMAH